MKINYLKPCPLSKLNSFHQNFMKLNHIVMYCNVFYKFNNGPYHTMLSGVMALCLWKFTVWNNVRFLSWIVLIRTLWNLVTLFSTMFSSSSIMVHILPSFQDLWPFVYENSQFETMSPLSWKFLIRTLWNLVTLFSTMFSSSSIMVHIPPSFQELWPFVYENSQFETMSAL